jgi:hypothetical protein
VPERKSGIFSSSRKEKILSGGIHVVFRGLKFLTDAKIGKNNSFRLDAK